MIEMILNAIQNENCIKITENGVFIEIPVLKEKNEFKNFIQELDDEIFVETCERIGNIATLQKCLDSNDIESIRSAILRFKNELKNVLSDKINEYTKCLNCLNNCQ